MTTHGVVDMFFVPTNTAKLYSEMYVSISRFMTSSYAQAIGIQRIAYNTGSGGTGANYWDENLAIGQNAWSVYCFTSASTPFYMLMAYNDANIPNSAPAFPGAVESTTNQSGIYFAFAQRPDGSSPWAGSTNNNGSDYKGGIVWLPASGTNNSLYVWPRSNSISGSFATRREDTMGMITSKNIPANPSAYTRAHFVCDENNVFATSDEGSSGGYYSMFFGTYTPRSGSYPSCPYVSLRTAANTDDPHFPVSTYGGTSGGQFTRNGGIAHPLEPMSGTRTCQTSMVTTFLAANFSPNGAFPQAGVFDEWPIYVGMNDIPTYGFCGTIDYIRTIWGVNSLETNYDLTRCYVGAASLNSSKISFPWNGTTTPGTCFHRTGVMF